MLRRACDFYYYFYSLICFYFAEGYESIGLSFGFDIFLNEFPDIKERSFSTLEDFYEL